MSVELHNVRARIHTSDTGRRGGLSVELGIKYKYGGSRFAGAPHRQPMGFGQQHFSFAQEQDEASVSATSPLIRELLQFPFPRLRSRWRSVDFYDCSSNNFVGLKIHYGVIDFETRERHYDRYDRARSCAELEWMW